MPRRAASDETLPEQPADYGDSLKVLRRPPHLFQEESVDLIYL